MFPARYFTPAYFTPTYFPKIGSNAPITNTIWGGIERRTPINGRDHPEFQISKDEWNDALVVMSDAVDGALMIRDRTQPDGWGFTDVLPAFLGVPPWRTINGHPLSSNVVLTPADLGLGNVENVALSTWPGSTTLTTLGTVTTGTWRGAIIQPPYGGTGSPYVGFTGPTQRRTYNLPDTDATLLTNLSTIPPSQGGTGVTTGLTQLDASNLTMGIVPDARLSGNIGRTNVANNILWMAVNKAGSSLADLEVRSAGDLNTGIVPIERLPPEVVLGPLSPSTLPLHHANHERYGIDPIKLDDLAPPDNNADLDSSALTHGLLPRLSGNPSHRLSGVGLWTSDGVLPPFPMEPLLFLNGVGEWNYPAGNAPTAGLGDVIGPLTSVHQHIAVFSGTSGKVIADGGMSVSGVVDSAVAGSISAILPVDLAGAQVTGILPPSHLPATVQYKPIAVGDLPFHHLTHEPGGVDALTKLDASVLTQGTIPDARLSTNVARRDVFNTFVMNQMIQNAAPTLILWDTAQVPDARAFYVTNTGGRLQFQAGSDNHLVFTGVVAIDRAGVLTATAGLGATPLNATNLVSGTVADARLSLNVPLLDAPTNHFTGVLIADGGLGTTPLNASNITAGLLPPAQLPGHHATHEANGSDPLKLDALAVPDDVTTLNATTARHGLLLKLSGAARDVFTGTGVWQAFGVNLPSGTLAQQPTGLGAAQAGLLYMVLAPYFHLCRWNGTVWEFAPGDCGNGYFSSRALGPQEPGWVLCNGQASDYLVIGGTTLTTAAFTTPNATTGVYLKAAGTYGTLTPAQPHSVAGAMGAAGAHAHTGNANPAGSHTHNAGTYSAGSHSHSGGTSAAGGHAHSGSADVVTGEIGGVSSVQDSGTTTNTGPQQVWRQHKHTFDHGHSLSINGVGDHTHGLSVDPVGDHYHYVWMDPVADHAHTLAIAAVGDHAHGLGSLAVSGGDPANLSVTLWFRR